MKAIFVDKEILPANLEQMRRDSAGPISFHIFCYSHEGELLQFLQNEEGVFDKCLNGESIHHSLKDAYSILSTTEAAIVEVIPFDNEQAKYIFRGVIVGSDKIPNAALNHEMHWTGVLHELFAIFWEFNDFGV